MAQYPRWPARRRVRLARIPSASALCTHRQHLGDSLRRRDLGKLAPAYDADPRLGCFLLVLPSLSRRGSRVCVASLLCNRAKPTRAHHCALRLQYLPHHARHSLSGTAALPPSRRKRDHSDLHDRRCAPHHRRHTRQARSRSFRSRDQVLRSRHRVGNLMASA
jgi:hypothetical protein